MKLKIWKDIMRTNWASYRTKLTRYLKKSSNQTKGNALKYTLQKILTDFSSLKIQSKDLKTKDFKVLLSKQGLNTTSTSPR